MGPNRLELLSNTSSLNFVMFHVISTSRNRLKDEYNPQLLKIDGALIFYTISLLHKTHTQVEFSTLWLLIKREWKVGSYWFVGATLTG
jgi:hypothetical protein